MSLVYEDKSSLIPENKYLFSVTDINLFLGDPNRFFRKVVLKDEEYQINFNATLGTIIHHLCSSYYENKHLKDINKEIEDFVESLNPEEIDKRLLLEKYGQMIDVVISTLDNNKFMYGEPTAIEQSYIQQVTENVYLGGTLDIRFGNILMDYKTTTNKYIKPESEVSQRYLNQLYGYSWLCYKNNLNIETLMLQYFTQPELNRYSEVTSKVLKSYPCRDVLQFIRFEEEKLIEIEKLINLIAETIEYILKNKKSFGLFARDLNLEFKPKRRNNGN